MKINGKGPYNFVLDTGATFTCIDQPVATELKLPEWNQQVGIGIAVQTANAAKLVDIETLEVGTASAQKLKECVIDFKNFQTAGLNIHGLLGLNFLKSYRMTIDFSRKVITLDKMSTDSADRRLRTLSFTPRLQPGAQVPLNINAADAKYSFSSAPAAIKFLANLFTGQSHA